jgi:hypothetical protein
MEPSNSAAGVVQQQNMMKRRRAGRAVNGTAPPLDGGPSAS